MMKYNIYKVKQMMHYIMLKMQRNKQNHKLKNKQENQQDGKKSFKN